ncbi:hypothetical protein WAI453_013644 [Rhynchosporium graminicola]
MHTSPGTREMKREETARQPKLTRRSRDITFRNDPRSITKPFFEELQKLFDCFCGNFLPAYTFYSCHTELLKWESEKVPKRAAANSRQTREKELYSTRSRQRKLCS